MDRLGDKTKVAVGFSGGVDSTAACLLLKEKGYDVHPVYLRMGEAEDISELKKIANDIGLELKVLDLTDRFNNSVIDNFKKAYMNGMTPNPCIVCNPLVKFRGLMNFADDNGIDLIATGHYARIVKNGDNPVLCRGRNAQKDQSYMLYGLDSNVFERLILPLGEYGNKEDIRNILRTNEIINSEKPDSQEICFLKQDESYKKFFPEREGEFVDAEGNILGRHRGIHNFTVGQRKGLGITFSKPMYVLGIAASTNRVMLGSEEELYKERATITDVKYLGNDISKCTDDAHKGLYRAKVRYSSAEYEIKEINLKGSDLEIVFNEPVRAIAPGQSLVVYCRDVVILGGIIVG